jgi:hypothetical protein
VSAPTTAVDVLIAHQRRDAGSCLCGWAELGRSHASHQVDALREVFAGVWDEGYVSAWRTIRRWSDESDLPDVNPYRPRSPSQALADIINAENALTVTAMHRFAAQVNAAVEQMKESE